MVILGSVMKNLVSKPATRTTGREPFTGARAKLSMDLEQCTFCGLCQKRCPAGALEVNRQEKTWLLRAERCILCNYCVEGCPKKCLHMATEFREPVTDRMQLHQVGENRPA